MSKRPEILDYKLRAYRTVNEGDTKFQNWRSASTVTLELFVEIDGIEIPIAAQTLAHAAWERQMKKWSESQKETTPAPSRAA